jgi:enoyl-CoA hydratase/carnithine racemase
VECPIAENFERVVADLYYADMDVRKQTESPSVIYSLVAEHVGLLTISRPSVRNAIDQAVTKSLDVLVDQIESDPDIWVMVITGAEKCFCAGADLNEVAAGRLSQLFTRNGFAGFTHAKRQKPWIAAVEGVAAAGGFEIALACDMIVASEDARFSLPEVRRGLIASSGGVYRLPRALPRHIALELIATGAFLSAQRGFDLGLLNCLAKAGEAVADAVALASRICANAPIAVRESLLVARSAFDQTDSELFRLGNDAQARVLASEDFMEGPRAFLEKRTPLWTNS